MNFLVDVGVGRGIERYLQKEGYDPKTVRDIDPRMEDAEIIRIAVAEKRMIVTMDKDFGELVHRCSMEHSGVLLLRLEDASGSTKLQIFKHIMEKHSAQIRNCFCVYQHKKLRIKRTTRT